MHAGPTASSEAPSISCCARPPSAEAGTIGATIATSSVTPTTLLSRSFRNREQYASRPGRFGRCRLPRLRRVLNRQQRLVVGALLCSTECRQPLLAGLHQLRRAARRLLFRNEPPQGFDAVFLAIAIAGLADSIRVQNDGVAR